jgi:O-antigen ligase
VLALWLVRFWINPRHQLLWPPLCWAVVAFMAYALGRYLVADIEYFARQEVIKVIIYGSLFLAILHNLHRLDTSQVVGLILIGLATAISIYGVIQFLTRSDTVWHFIRPTSYFRRGSGTFINPNHFAGYLEMLFPLALAYTLTGRFSHVAKVILAYASVVIFAGLMVSVSRGAWIATTITLLFLCLWLVRMRDYRWRTLIVVAVFATMTTLFVLKAEFSSERKATISEVLSEGNIRVILWQSAVEIWRDNFWIGAGPAHFDFRFRQYRPIGKYPDRVQVRPDRAHNDYLNTLADWGLLGTLLVAGAWMLFYWDVIRGWKYVQRAQNDLGAKRSNKASFVMGGSLGLLAILLHSFTDYNMHMPANAILAVTLMALIAGHFRFTTGRYWQTVNGPLRIAITVILATIMGWLGVQSWKGSRERVWLGRAEAQPYYSTDQIAALEKAFAIEPKNSDTAYLIGEGYRMHSWEGGENHEELARTAMAWLQRAMKLNPYDPYPRLRYGMCLHWIDKHEAAEPYFQKALELDPNGYYTRALMGWHHFQLGEWSKAKEWFEKSLRVFWTDNPIARSYLELLKEKLPHG